MPSSQCKRTSPLLLEDFIDQLGNGNFEQMGRSGSKGKGQNDKGDEVASNSFFSKTTFGEAQYLSYGSISIEQLQFISLDKKFVRSAMTIKEGEGEKIAENIQNFIKDIDPSRNPKAVFHPNYVRGGTIFKEGEVGILLDDEAIDILVKETLRIIEELSIRQAKGYMYVDSIWLITTMGVLNRLIGDKRKLYQSREGQDYFFSGLEPHITFSNLHDENNETIFVRNITGSSDQNSFSGMIKANDPVFNSDYSSEFLGILTLDINDRSQFINNAEHRIFCTEQFDPICVLQKLEILNKLKVIDVKNFQRAIETLKECFPDTDYKITDGKIKPIELYCSALYLQISRLSGSYNVSAALTKNGGIAGISKCGFTLKDFMAKYTTGNKKNSLG